MAQDMAHDYDIIIIGAGHAGLIAAIAAAKSGFTAALIDRADIDLPRRDIRASTLAATSLTMLGALGLTEAISGQLQPVNDMLIGEGRVGDISPLSLHFDGDLRARHDGRNEMAHIIENEALRRACAAKVQDLPGITVYAPANVTSIETSEAGASVTLGDEQVLGAPLIIAADGRNSAARKAANIAVSPGHAAAFAAAGCRRGRGHPARSGVQKRK